MVSVPYSYFGTILLQGGGGKRWGGGTLLYGRAMCGMLSACNRSEYLVCGVSTQTSPSPSPLHVVRSYFTNGSTAGMVSELAMEIRIF